MLLWGKEICSCFVQEMSVSGRKENEHFTEHVDSAVLGGYITACGGTGNISLAACIISMD